jgi:hypothetical protein
VTLVLDDLARLEALERAATPAPWADGSASCCPDMGWVDGPAGKGKVCPQYEGTKTTHTLDANDAALIAAIRNALPALLADHARLTDEVADLRDDIAAGEQGRDYLRSLVEEAQRGQRKAEAEVARLRGLVAAITNPITNPASIEHGLVMTDDLSEPFAEGDAEQRPSQTCACSSAYREIGPGIHAKYCALAGQPLDDGRQRWRCTACDSVSTVDRCPQCGGMMIAADP